VSIMFAVWNLVKFI